MSEINNEKYLPCPFCGDKPSVEEKLRTNSSWDGKYLKYYEPEIWVKCKSDDCVIQPSSLDSGYFRRVAKKSGEKTEDMQKGVWDEVRNRSLESWNERNNTI